MITITGRQNSHAGAPLAFPEIYVPTIKLGIRKKVSQFIMKGAIMQIVLSFWNVLSSPIE